MRHETLIGSSIFKGGGIIFVVELPKCQFLEFFFSWHSQFAGEESCFISGLGGKNFDATILGTKLGRKAGSQQAFSQSPYFHATSHPCLCPWDQSLWLDISRNSYHLSLLDGVRESGSLTAPYPDLHLILLSCSHHPSFWDAWSLLFLKPSTPCRLFLLGLPSLQASAVILCSARSVST